ncbi:hypothetical protein [Ktedonospora formicarum]|nr:hypothetical protein [Ktedonospora formicarum]
MRQVLKHDSRTRSGVLYDAFAEDMVMVFALPKPFAREPAQVALRALGAFGLQLATQTEETALLLFPAPLAQEVPLSETYPNRDKPYLAFGSCFNEQLAWIYQVLQDLHRRPFRCNSPYEGQL